LLDISLLKSIDLKIFSKKPNFYPIFSLVLLQILLVYAIKSRDLILPTKSIGTLYFVVFCI